MPYPVFFVTGDLDIGLHIGLITRNGQLEILLVIKVNKPRMQALLGMARF